MKTQVSKFIALILRHKPEVIGIALDKHGWANTEELIAGIKKNPGFEAFDMELLKEIVATDEKQRYAFNEDMTRIRANQGHSIPVDLELPQIAPPKYLWHGTAEKYVSSIEKNGLIPKSRLHVHLSKDLETATMVGKRHGTLVLYQVNTGQMAKDGYKFYLSANGVWLTDKVPAEYLRRVECPKSESDRIL